MSNRVSLMDGKFNEYQGELCCDQECLGECELEWHYGFMGGYGLGIMQFCMKCRAIHNFSEDTGK